jgi:nucleoside-diphosphate-sugar epimerase
MKCLVCGGKGFIGSHMVNYLKQKGHYVVSVDSKPVSFLKTIEDEFYRLDLRNLEDCNRIVKSGVEWIFNFSANMGGIGFITKYKADIVYDNVLINANILRSVVSVNALRASASSTPKVDRVFFASSACIYPSGVQSDENIRINLKESDAFPAYPDSAYGWEKLFSEIMYQSFHEDYGLDVRIARYHNIYGPHGTYKGGREKAPAALCRKVAEAKNNGKIEIWGSGKQRRSFLHVDDCVEATYRLMASDRTQPLNIGSDKDLTIDELADIIIQISGKALSKTHNLNAPVGVKSRNADLTILKDVLHWQPTVSYEEGLKQTYNWINSKVQADK